MKIFLLEDDVDFVRIIKKILKPYYIVESAKNISEAEQLFDQNEYDLFIIDLSVPDGNGIDFCHYIRNNNSSSPILILTGSTNFSQKITALKTVADDYLSKPFHSEELLARIQALLRRPTTYLADVLTIADLKLDTHQRTVIRSGTEINLRPKEFSLLEFLLRNKGLVITRDMIISHVWNNSYESITNIVDVHIRNLRELVDRPFQKNLIHTIHGVGYKIDEKK